MPEVYTHVHTTHMHYTYTHTHTHTHTHCTNTNTHLQHTSTFISVLNQTNCSVPSKKIDKAVKSKMVPSNDVNAKLKVANIKITCH